MRMRLLYLVLTVSSSAKCRKYDIDDEAVKLYGEELKPVLQRFRKTPDYLHIIEDKVSDIKQRVTDLEAQVRHHYYGNMTQKIEELLGSNTDTRLRSKLDAHTDKKHSGLRQGQEPDSPVAILDGFHRFHQVLTTGDINYFKDMGFEYAGNVIHAMIKHMGAEDMRVRSTLHPFGGGHFNNSKTTTEHARVHKVISSTDSDITISDALTSSSTTFF